MSHEHEEAIAFADNILGSIDESNSRDLNDAINEVKKYYAEKLKAHLQHEELTIFAPLLRDHNDQQNLATRLLQEHGLMRSLAHSIDIKKGDASKDVKNFAEILKAHTIVEETVLFPLIEKLFSTEQLALVKDSQT